MKPFLPNRTLCISAITCALLFTSGCATTKTMYDWGNYENILYKMYKEPGSQTPEVQIEALTQNIQKGEAEGKKVPPGLYAHLGLMHSIAGNEGKAQEALNMEKSLFPDSAILIDGMLDRAKKSQSSAN